MRKFILFFLLLVNVFYIVNYLINFETLPLNILWIVFFILSVCVSIIFLFRSRKQNGYNPLLPIIVLAVSIGSLGAYGFLYYIAHLMG